MRIWENRLLKVWGSEAHMVSLILYSQKGPMSATAAPLLPAGRPGPSIASAIRWRRRRARGAPWVGEMFGRVLPANPTLADRFSWFLWVVINQMALEARRRGIGHALETAMQRRIMGLWKRLRAVLARWDAGTLTGGAGAEEYPSPRPSPTRGEGEHPPPGPVRPSPARAGEGAGERPPRWCGCRRSCRGRLAGWGGCCRRSNGRRSCRC